jgi:hypothetical protein
MNLKEWCSSVGVIPTTPTTERGAVSFTFDVTAIDPTMLWFLYHLTDYAVSSVTGPVVWLVPREDGRG